MKPAWSMRRIRESRKVRWKGVHDKKIGRCDSRLFFYRKVTMLLVIYDNTSFRSPTPDPNRCHPTHGKRHAIELCPLGSISRCRPLSQAPVLGGGQKRDPPCPARGTARDQASFGRLRPIPGIDRPVRQLDYPADA